MPANPTNGFEIQDLPENAPPAKLPSLINTRFRDIKAILNKLVRNGSTVDVDLGEHRIINVADPKNDLDVVNLRTLRKQAQPARKTEETTTAATPFRPTYYNAVFTKDGFVADEEESPYFTVWEHRQGEPQHCLITAKTAPAGVSLKVNFRILRPDATEPEDLLLLPLEIEAGSTGPVATEDLLIHETLPKGTRVYMRIVAGGDAAQVEGQVLLRNQS